MKPITLLLSLIIAVILYSCNHKQDKNNNNDKQLVDAVTIDFNKGITYPVTALNKTRHLPTDESDTLYAVLGHSSFIIYPTGLITRSENGKLSATYKLHTTDNIEAAFLWFYNNDLIVYYTDSDGESGASFVESFNMRTNKFKWKANTFGFNLGQPVNKGHISYVSTIGFVGKLNLETGLYFWKHDGLYNNQSYSFNKFDTIHFIANNVIFLAKNLSKKSTDSVIVNDATGNIEIRNNSLFR